MHPGFPLGWQSKVNPVRQLGFDRLQHDRRRQAARMRVLTRRQSSSIACHSSSQIHRPSPGHLSGPNCILRSGKMFRLGLGAPSIPPRRGASNFVLGCTRPADDTANPLRANVELFALVTSSARFPPSLFLFFASESLSLCNRTNFTSV